MLFLLCSIYTLIKGAYDYTILLLLLYPLIDAFLSPTTITIEDALLTIHRLLLGGILQKKRTIRFTNITKLQSIGLDISNDSNPEVDGTLIWFSKETSEKLFDLYLIEYFDSEGKLRKTKLHLLVNEYNMIKNSVKQHTSNSGLHT